MTSADEGPLLRLEHYEGPLDLLLDHVRARRIDLTRLSILEIVEQFAVALEAVLRGQRLERLSEWVVTA